jgi:hypothetical protein
MSILEGLAFLLIGFCSGIGVVFILQRERLITADKHLRKFVSSLNEYFQKRSELQRQLASVKSEIRELEQSTMRMLRERDAMNLAWLEDETSLQSTNRVNVDETIVFGRGQEWVYLYTFPAHEQLAQARQQKLFPMKLGMSAQSNVVDRVHQQVSGNSTAISERAIVRLVFRVNSSRDVEAWMHEYLKRNGRQVSGSVGVEWFNTNPVEVEQLFRSYVLQRIEATRPASVKQF